MFTPVNLKLLNMQINSPNPNSKHKKEKPSQWLNLTVIWMLEKSSILSNKMDSQSVTSKWPNLLNNKLKNFTNNTEANPSTKGLLNSWVQILSLEWNLLLIIVLKSGDN